VSEYPVFALPVIRKGSVRVTWKSPKHGKRVIEATFEHPITHEEIPVWCWNSIGEYAVEGKAPHKASIVFGVTEEGNLVQVYQFRWGSACCIPEAPGGHKLERPSGESQEDAGLREFAEETGYSIGTLIPLGSIWVDPPSNGAQVVGYLAFGCKKAGVAKLDKTEFLAVVETPIEEWFAAAADPENKQRDAKCFAFAFSVFTRLPLSLQRRVRARMGISG
jgi:ADP-ribose pyrophosphatase YjhB (NUDIX family)